MLAIKSNINSNPIDITKVTDCVMFDRSLEYSMLLLGDLYADITMNDLLESYSILLAIISQSQSVTFVMSMGLLLIFDLIASMTPPNPSFLSLRNIS
jgi:predicted nicotinamide N-methyase